MYFLQNPGKNRHPQAAAVLRGASARPGRPARQLCSEPPRRSWCGGPEAARTCGARQACPSSDLSVPGITKAVALATSEAVGGRSSCLRAKSKGSHEPGAQHPHCKADRGTSAPNWVRPPAVT